MPLTLRAELSAIPVTAEAGIWEEPRLNTESILQPTRGAYRQEEIHNPVSYPPAPSHTPTVQLPLFGFYFKQVCACLAQRKRKNINHSKNAQRLD